MRFRRTSTGLSNLHLFLRVNAVVFVEGGTSFSLDQVLAGAYESESIDILFWQNMFLHFQPTKKLQFRAIGSKTTLSSIAEEVVNGKTTHVYVAMDRDHDNSRGSLKSGPGVLHTFGYSWENDVWNAEVIEAMFYTLCPVCRSGAAVKAEIDSCFDQFTREIRWAVYADILLSHYDLSLLPREKPESVLTIAAKGRPSLNRGRVHSLIRKVKGKRAERISLGRRFTFDPASDCVGHVLGAFGYRLLVYLLKSFSGIPSLPKHYAHAVAIEKLLGTLRAGRLKACRRHYARQFAALP
jgi:hypothetical protein